MSGYTPKRLDAYEANFKRVGKSNLKDIPGYDPQSLKKATARFGLYPEDPSDLLILAHLLANLVFGQRKRGRQKGDQVVWDERKNWVLAFAYSDLKNQHPRLRDNKIVERICELEEFKGHKNSESIRVRLPKMKKTYEMFASDESEIWDYAKPD